MVKEPNFDFVRLIRIEINLIDPNFQFCTFSLVDNNEFWVQISLFYRSYEHFELLVHVVDRLTLWFCDHIYAHWHLYQKNTNIENLAVLTFLLESKGRMGETWSKRILLVTEVSGILWIIKHFFESLGESLDGFLLSRNLEEFDMRKLKINQLDILVNKHLIWQNLSKCHLMFALDSL